MRAHGTSACYVWGPEPGAGKGCRCDPCRAARAAYERARSTRVAPSYVAAGRARRHVEELMADGIGIKTISKRSGVSTGVLSKLLYGQPSRGRGPSKRIRPETESRLLAVAPSDRAGGALVDAAETWTHIDTLLARGWTKVAIAREIGQTGPGLQLRRTKVQARHARAVKALLDAPVPARRSKWGVHEVPAPVEDDEAAPVVKDYNLPTFGAEGDTEWMRRGACRVGRDVPTWMFFPQKGDRATLRAAKAVCATCPVAERCLAYALEHHEPGVWGGTSEKERREMRRGAA